MVRPDPCRPCRRLRLRQFPGRAAFHPLVRAGTLFRTGPTTDFITRGLERLDGRHGDWRAEVGTIEAQYDDAVAHNADFVFSSNVAYHVHPDECCDYYARLAGLVHQPDSILCFDNRIARGEVRFGDRNWAYPLDFQVKSLPQFKLVQTFPTQDKLDALMDAHEVLRVIFHFERQ